MAPIGEYHVGGNIWLIRLLVQALGDRALVQSQCPIYLSDRSAPEPDLAVVRWRPISESSLSFPSDVYLVVEIADSSLRYDSGPKLARYAAAGIPEVWVANLRAREVTAHTSPAGSEYTSIRVYRSGDIHQLRRRSRTWSLSSRRFYASGARPGRGNRVTISTALRG